MIASEPEEPAARTVAFVCLHGAGKSRVAAAIFDAAAPPGWQATSAGIEPQAQISGHAETLLAGHPAAARLDNTAPRRLTEMTADLTVAIDCTIPGARSWELTGVWPDPAVCKELDELTTALASELTNRKTE